MSTTQGRAFYTSTNTVLPPTQGLREFLRGGYRLLTVPTTIVDYRHQAIGTWVPGEIESSFDWTASEPSWLKGDK
jgi:hypothetical protein